MTATDFIFTPMDIEPVVPLMEKFQEPYLQPSFALDENPLFVSLLSTAEDILSVLQFSQAELDAFYNLPPVSIQEKSGKEIQIPAAYVRTKGLENFKKAWLNSKEATHDLIVDDMMPTDLSEMLYPINEMVLLCQCGSWEDLLMVSEEQAPDRPPLLSLIVPAIKQFDALLFWLHHHDEQVLYEFLKGIWANGTIGGQYRLRGFCMNVRHLGIVDPRIRGIVLAVLEPSM